MRYLIFTLFIGFIVLLFAFREKDSDKVASPVVVATTDHFALANDSFVHETLSENEKEVSVNALHQTEESIQAREFVEYAKTLTGTPYLYGSVDPTKGLDCSGFINAVSNHFGIKVPRSSVEFTNAGTTINVEKAQPGDLILFTGTDPKKRVVGHIGIITDNNAGHLKFIHSSSGKAKGVTTSDLDGYYQTRFVKVIRILPDVENKVVA